MKPFISTDEITADTPLPEQEKVFAITLFFHFVFGNKAESSTVDAIPQSALILGSILKYMA
jgi:hypothetical protein